MLRVAFSELARGCSNARRVCALTTAHDDDDDEEEECALITAHDDDDDDEEEEEEEELRSIKAGRAESRSTLASVVVVDNDGSASWDAHSSLTPSRSRLFELNELDRGSTCWHAGATCWHAGAASGGLCTTSTPGVEERLAGGDTENAGTFSQRSATDDQWKGLRQKAQRPDCGRSPPQTLPNDAGVEGVRAAHSTCQLELQCRHVE